MMCGPHFSMLPRPAQQAYYRARHKWQWESPGCEELIQSVMESAAQTVEAIRESETTRESDHAGH